MRKHYIVPIIILIVLAGIAGASYQFVFRKQLEQYAANVEQMKEVRDKLSAIEKKFKGKNNRSVKPDVAVAQYHGAVEPWADALRERAAYYNMPVQYNAAPEGAVPKFYYREAFPAAVEELQRYAYTRGVFIPQTTFGAPPVSDLDNRAVTAGEVNLWLKNMAIGSSMTRQLIDAGATEIRQVYLWPPYLESNLVELQTIAVDFSAPVDKVAGFLDTLYNAERYFSVNNLKIQNSMLRNPYQPQLEVQMLVTQAAYLDSGEPAIPTTSVVTASIPRPSTSTLASATTASAAPPPAAAAPAQRPAARPDRGGGAVNDKISQLREQMDRKREEALAAAKDPKPKRSKPWWAKIIPF